MYWSNRGLVQTVHRYAPMYCVMPRDLTPVHLPSPVLFCPAGSRHQSHQDYMEKANQARSERLSSGQPTIK
ncbi:hypothetical protein GW17_00028721 [Ensete ventricosum]|nr:hypothetical protein GW17_00028721 [Ensete ventricosum]